MKEYIASFIKEKDLSENSQTAYSYDLDQFVDTVHNHVSDTKDVYKRQLLHDLFYYDWRQVKFNKSHAWVHPRIAVRNAKKITSLNKKEEDIILKHMWGLTLAPPRYKESFQMCIRDRYFVFESDEYERHFMPYHPEYSIITNIDFDHPDYFTGLEDVFNACLLYTSSWWDKGFQQEWARLEERFSQLQKPLILAGDFNNPAGQEGYEAILASPLALQDSFIEARQTKGTYTVGPGIDGWDDNQVPLRIDYIFTSKGWVCLLYTSRCV